MFLEISENSRENTCARDFFNKVAGLRPATLLKKNLWHRYFPVNFSKFLRTPISTEHLWWLLPFIVMTEVPSIEKPANQRTDFYVIETSVMEELKKRLCHRCLPVNFAKFLRTLFLTEHLQWLLLKDRKL